jgi:hypothetical protein
MSGRDNFLRDVPWTRQPQIPVGVNRGNPITAGTIFAGLFSCGVVDVSSSRIPCTLVNGPGYGILVAGNAGSAYAVTTFPSGGSRRIDLGTPAVMNLSSSDSFSMMIHVSQSSAAGAGKYPGLFVKQGTTNNFAFYFGIDGDTSSKVYFALAKSGVSSNNAYETSAASFGDWVQYVGTYPLQEWCPAKHCDLDRRGTYFGWSCGTAERFWRLSKSRGEGFHVPGAYVEAVSF